MNFVKNARTRDRNRIAARAHYWGRHQARLCIRLEISPKPETGSKTKRHIVDFQALSTGTVVQHHSRVASSHICLVHKAQGNSDIIFLFYKNRAQTRCVTRTRYRNNLAVLSRAPNEEAVTFAWLTASNRRFWTYSQVDYFSSRAARFWVYSCHSYLRYVEPFWFHLPSLHM